MVRLRNKSKNNLKKWKKLGSMAKGFWYWTKKRKKSTRKIKVLTLRSCKKEIIRIPDLYWGIVQRKRD